MSPGDEELREWARPLPASLCDHADRAARAVAEMIRTTRLNFPQHWPYGDVAVEVHGSERHGTAIHASDVDVAVTVPASSLESVGESGFGSFYDAISFACDAREDRFFAVAREIGGRPVDIVPRIADDDGMRVRMYAGKGYGGWVENWPDFYANRLQAKDARVGGRLREVIRVSKELRLRAAENAWSDGPIRSYHLENALALAPDAVFLTPLRTSLEGALRFTRWLLKDRHKAADSLDLSGRRRIFSSPEDPDLLRAANGIVDIWNEFQGEWP